MLTNIAKLRQYYKFTMPLVLPTVLVYVIFTVERQFMKTAESTEDANPVGRQVVFQCDSVPGKIVDADFAIENASNKTVKLLGANVSCGCTSAKDLYPIVIKPHRTAKLTFGITVGSGDRSGHFIKTIRLLANSNAVPNFLVFDANLRKGD